MPIQVFVSQININKIKLSLINKLKNTYKYNEIDEEIYYTKDGYYTIKDDTVTLHKILCNESYTIEKFLNKYDLYLNNYYIKKINTASQLPVSFLKLKLKKVYFNLPNSPISFVIEFKNNNEILNIYFLSKNKINTKDYFFYNDISLYLESLNI
tara:strand:- start:7776 stop:8237 length:462 start_codon:yes stop_codon:yes gene_type:complete